MSWYFAKGLHITIIHIVYYYALFCSLSHFCKGWVHVKWNFKVELILFELWPCKNNMESLRSHQMWRNEWIRDGISVRGKSAHTKQCRIPADSSAVGGWGLSPGIPRHNLSLTAGHSQLWDQWLWALRFGDQWLSALSSGDQWLCVLGVSGSQLWAVESVALGISGTELWGSVALGSQIWGSVPLSPGDQCLSALSSRDEWL